MAKPISSARDGAARVKKVKRRKKKNKENGDAQLSVEEQARRELQRQIRDLVLRLKSEGKLSDKEIEAAKSELKKKLQGSEASKRTLACAANDTDAEGATTKAARTTENGEHRVQHNAEEKNYANTAKEKNDAATAKKKSDCAVKKKEKIKTTPADSAMEKKEKEQAKTADADETTKRTRTKSAEDVGENQAANSGEVKDADWREKKAFWEDAKKTNKTVALGAHHDIVVIPICWRGRHDHLEIVAAAQKVKDILKQQGLDAWIDSRRQYKPGQKFAYWEHLGLKYRVEIGPEDLEQSQCKVCKHGAPGDYLAVQKVAVPLPPRGAKRLLVQLKRFGMNKLEAIIDDGGDDVSDQDEDTDDAPVEKKMPLKKQELSTGDAMDENYVLEDRSLQKKKKKKARTA